MGHYGNRFFRGSVASLEWILKRVIGPDRWRPAGAIRVLPPSALVYDAQEQPRAEGVFHTLSLLGFSPTKVPVDRAAGPREVCRAITRGTADCWAAVVVEPADDSGAGVMGPAFRQFAHLHPEIVAVVVGPLPSRSQILDRYRHVVTDEAGAVAAPELAAGIAHASAARVLHCARLLNTAVLVLLVVLAAALALGALGWLSGGR